MKVTDRGRTIYTAKIDVCYICGYSIGLKHCVEHSGLRVGIPATRKVYAAEYVPPERYRKE